ncbi:MAG TPA: hypothetical protein VI636_14845 [Candidatus Angelobacter sp.]
MNVSDSGLGGISGPVGLLRMKQATLACLPASLADSALSHILKRKLGQKIKSILVVGCLPGRWPVQSALRELDREMLSPKIQKSG